MLRHFARVSRLRPCAYPPPVRLATPQIRPISGPYLAQDFCRPKLASLSTRSFASRQWPSDPPQNTPKRPPPPEDESDSAFPQDSTELPSSYSSRQRRADQPSDDSLESEAEAEQIQDGPTGPLPDLRQGIPSTLAAELEQDRPQQEAHRESLNITEDPSEPTAGGGGRGGDGLPRSEYISSSDRKKNAIFRFVYAGMLLSIVGYTAYLGRNWTDEEEAKGHPDAPDGWGIGLFYKRMKARLSSTMTYYSDPVSTKLLPDEDKDPNLRFPFVLVLSLEDMLIHEEWTREHGWRVAKRPGVDYFLRYLSQYYEIVLFTSKPYAIAEQVVRKMDPFHMIQWPLFREATLYKDGGYVKDLSYLNRPLAKVLMLDTDAHHAKHQPENAIILPAWDGDPQDQTLIQLIPFLEYLATMGLDDVRTVLKSFEGTYIPVEFARREKLLRQKFEAQQSEKRGGRPKRKLGIGLGLSSSDDALGEGKMIWDQIRERGQKNYELLEKRIRDEGEKWLAEQAAEQKKLEEEAMRDMKKGFLGWIPFGGNQPAATGATDQK